MKVVEMADGYQFDRLKTVILALSSADEWQAAKREWQLVGISQVESGEPDEECLCGHRHIRELCEIKNRTTGATSIVGNQCVRRFLGLETEALFRGIRRIRRDDLKSMGPDLAVWLFERRVLSQWEYDFQNDTGRKRSLSEKQQAIRQRINQKALTAIRRRGIA